MPCSQTSGWSCAGRSGRISPRTRSTSARLPTGSTMLNCCAVLDCCWERLLPLIRLILIVHHPNGRHSIDCVTSAAKMRPGGIVSVIVVNRPYVMRTPSGVGAIEYLSDFEICAQVMAIRSEEHTSEL